MVLAGIPSWGRDRTSTNPQALLSKELGVNGISPAPKEKAVSLNSGRKTRGGDPEDCGLEHRCDEVSALQLSMTLVTGTRQVGVRLSELEPWPGLFLAV